MHLSFAIMVLLDQITKSVFTGRDFFLAGLHLHPMRNYALPFGLDFGARFNFIVLLGVYLAVGWLVVMTPAKIRLHQVGKSMFLAGAASNLVDRLIFGYVRDYIDISLNFVFNLADVFIVLGLLMLMWPAGRPAPQPKPQA